MSDSPIYTVGNGKRTQLAQRSDGVWFMRTHSERLGWSKWRAQPSDPYPTGKYLAPRCGNARLPSE